MTEPSGSVSTTTDPATNGTTAPTVPTFTQEDLTRVAAREKDQGKQAGRRELEQEIQDEFGVDLATAKAMLKTAKEKADSEKSEAQRAKEAADAEKQAAATEKEQAALDKHYAKVERALFVAGIRPRDGEKDEDYDARLARARRLCTAAVGSDMEAIKADIETVRKEFPEVFGSKGAGPAPRSTEPQGGQGERRKPTPEGAAERGKARAAARNPVKIAS